MTFVQFESEVTALRHLFVSLKTVLKCVEQEGPQPEISATAVFLADELQDQLERVYQAARRLTAPANETPSAEASMAEKDIAACWRRINSLADALALIIQANEGAEPQSMSFLLSELRDALEELQERQGGSHG